MAARIFVALKDLGINTELASEFAKDKSWEGAHNTLACQPYITGTQIWRIERLVQAGVSVIVTDSPPLMGSVYAKDWPGIQEVVGKYHFKNPSINFLLERVKPFSQDGRHHSEAESKNLDNEIGWLLSHWGVDPWLVPGDAHGAVGAVKIIQEQL